MVIHLYFDYWSKYILKLYPKSMKTVCEKMIAKYIYTLQYNRVCYGKRNSDILPRYERIAK